ncbi:MAG: zf-HC2 domain-containing protein [Candidatus Aminicenantes bacterium]|nr:MAG: zf-HC2 domain-containing protein [Candidatus Aminicenantes bacterium]
MRNCKKTKRDLVAFLYNECNEIDKKQMEAHLETCQECKQELLELREVYEAADTLNADMEKALASVEWENFPAQIASVLDKDPTRYRQPRRAGFWTFLFQPRFRLAYAGLLLGIVVGSVVTFLIFRSPPLQIAEDGRIIAPQGFYDMMELEMARRETIDYLDRSEYLLLDFVQSSPEKSVEFWQTEHASRRAMDLLSKKKYIDPQLDKIKLAKAKFICDQIEFLFFELMQISDDLAAEELKKIQRLIQERQLLLKIKLVRKELQKSEV